MVLKHLPSTLKTLVFFNAVQFTSLISFLVVSSLSESFNVTKNVKFVCKIVCLFSIVLHLVRTCIIKVEDVVVKSRKIMIWSCVKGIFILLISILLLHLLTIIYGAPIIESYSETFHFASLLGCLSIFPCICVSISMTPQHLAFHFITLLFNINTKDNKMRSSSFIVMVGTVLGAWVGTFPIPLDWDVPWQTWPVSCVYGCLFGNLVGLMASSIIIITTHPPAKNKKFKKTI